MQLYIDLNCFNRPFDDQTQKRVQSETDAVFAILRRVSDGTDKLIWSWALWYENSKHPIPDRRDEIAQWQEVASLFVSPNDSLASECASLLLAASPRWMRSTWRRRKMAAPMF